MLNKQKSETELNPKQAHPDIFCGGEGGV